MATIVTILTEGFADWETALLNAVARSFTAAQFASPHLGAVPSPPAG